MSDNYFKGDNPSFSLSLRSHTKYFPAFIALIGNISKTLFNREGNNIKTDSVQCLEKLAFLQAEACSPEHLILLFLSSLPVD